MSIAEDIANMTAKFADKKTQEVLSNMSLDELAQVWDDIRIEHEAPASSPEQQEAKDKDFEERSKVLHDIVTQEKLQEQIQEYMVSLSIGECTPADFSKISEFCSSFSDEFKNDKIKNSLSNMMERMKEKRLSMDKEITLISDKEFADKFKLNIPELDSITIEGNKDVITALDNKTQHNGKTITFKDTNGEDLAGVEFDKDGNTDILLRDENGIALQYQITKDKHFYQIDDNGTKVELNIQDAQNIPPEARKALSFASSAKNVWSAYAKGELDKNIEKEINVSEGKAVKDKEPKKKTTVNEAIENDKEENDSPTGPKTTINEEKSESRKDGDLNRDTKHDKPEAEDELYWKEGDIIDTMFKEWFLAAANSVTNWCVHQIEYTVAGLWNEFENAYKQRQIERENLEKDSNKTDSTHDYFNNIVDTSNKSMNDLKQGYRGKKDNSQIIKDIKDGKIDDVIANNKLLQNLKSLNIDPAVLISQGDPEKTVPFVMGIASMVAKFSDDYAKASLLYERMHTSKTPSDTNITELYNIKKKEAALILQHEIIKDMQNNPNANPSEAIFQSIKRCTDEMTDAYKISAKDLDKKQYVENGKNPTKNEKLEYFQSMTNPPRTMQEEAQFTANRDAFIDFVKHGLEMEDSNIQAKEENLQHRHQALMKAKALFCEKQTQQVQIPLALDKQQQPQQQPLIFPIQGHQR